MQGILRQEVDKFMRILSIGDEKIQALKDTSGFDNFARIFEHQDKKSVLAQCGEVFIGSVMGLYVG